MPLSLETVSDVSDALDVDSFDMVVSLGGDGTILHSARLIGERGIPILGINFGHLGFLVNAADDGVIPIVAAALAGDVVREDRTSLHVEMYDEDDELVGKRFALNELAITRGMLGRIIDFDLRVAGVAVSHMRGDGLIISTATGSTGYALSAGGPLVAPGFTGLVVVPLAPHTLQARPIATGPSDVVEVDMSKNPESREASLFIDGELIEPQSRVQRIIVTPSRRPTTLLRYGNNDFYESVHNTFFKKCSL